MTMIVLFITVQQIQNDYSTKQRGHYNKRYTASKKFKKVDELYTQWSNYSIIYEGAGKYGER